MQNEGTIEIDGEPVWENEALKKKVLVINDDWFFFGTFTVKEMADFYRSMYKSFNNERYEKLGAIFGIDEKKQIRRLSKGMKKQVAFRMVLSCMPEVLILDEPLDGLDPVMRKQIMNVMISDVAEREMTVVVSSHNLRELEDICDHVGIIHKGKMVIEKALDEIKGNVLKVQVAFSDGFPEALKSELDILHTTSTGSVHTIIVKGTESDITAKIREYSPVVLDTVSLTLEEVFIYELGGLGYDFESIMV